MVTRGCFTLRGTKGGNQMNKGSLNSEQVTGEILKKEKKGILPKFKPLDSSFKSPPIMLKWESSTDQS